MHAADGASDQTVAFLLSKGASPDLMDKDGDTALVYAIQTSCSSTIDLLAPVTQKGKVVRFFRPTFPNPLPMLSIFIWGLFPIGKRLEHLHWIGSIGGGAGMPMLCQFRTMHYQSPAN